MPQSDTTYTPFYKYIPIEPITDFDSVTFSLEQVFDSINANDSIIITQSIFKEHQLQVSNHEATPRQQVGTESWIFIIIIGIIIGICTYFRRRRIEILSILQSAIDYRSMNRTFREYNLGHHTALIPIVLLWSANIALIVYLFTVNYIKEILPIHGSIIYAGILLLCVLYYDIRNGLFNLLGKTFRIPEATDLYIMSNYIYGLLEAVALPLMLLFVFYGGPISVLSTKITIIALGFLYITRIFRSLKLFLTYTKFSQLHLFYYLCILEFVPIMLLIYGIIYM